MKLPLEPRLAALALRRALHPGRLFPLAALALILGLVDWRAAPGIEGLGAAAGRGLARQAIWLGGLCFLVPACLLHAARVVPRWRRRDAAWLATRRLGALGGLASIWCGLALAGLIALLPLFAAGEWAARGSAPTWRPAGELAPGAAAPLPRGGGWRWSLADPGARAPAGSRLRLAFDLQALAGPGAEVRLELRRSGNGPEPRAVASGGRFTRAAELELELPPGPGALELELSRIGAGAALAPGGARATLLVPAGSERAEVLALGLRLAVALAGAAGLALGLGAWLSAPTAVVLTAIAAAAPLPALLRPAGGLGLALEALGRGLGPPAGGAQAACAALAFAGLGLLLARAGLSSGGSR